VAELGKRCEALYALIADIQPRERSEAGMELFQLFHLLVVLERLVRKRRLYVTHRAPDASWYVELANMGQFAQRLEILRLRDGAVHIDHDNAKVGIRQIERVSDRIWKTSDHDLATLADYPECDLTLFRRR